MDFALDGDQEALVDLARSILGDHCGDDQLRAFAASGAPCDTRLWQLLAEAGLTGVGIAEAQGGTGCGMLEAALLIECAGAALAPVPLRETLICARTLAMVGDTHGDLVARAAAGAAILASACDETANAWQTPATQARRDTSGGWRLAGERPAVAWGMEAQAILISAWIESEGCAGLFLVPADAAGLVRQVQAGTDATPLALLTLADVALPASALLDGGAGSSDLLRWHLGEMRVGLAASQLGIAGEALRRTAAYTAERVQFGRPVGSMQAVQQRAADAYIDLEAMRSTLWRAAWLIDQGLCDDAEITVAKYWAAIGGHRITHTAQHQHGGMGADVTYPIHRYFLAAKAVEAALGGTQPMLAELGTAIASGVARRLSAIGGGFDAL
ncbi:MAG: acyl-CoA/acyl-ACP dehydrogenase [Pseudomonadales bacterium]|nr:acyl-CoA/acyl-ACP dehydrogenase [Pseudomonadales bacterium]